MSKILKLSLLIFAIAFVLNLIWENLHAPFYGGYENFLQFLPLVSISSVWDGIIILGIYAVIAAIKRDMYWFEKMNYSSVLLALVLGMSVAVYIEMRALREGRWGYQAIMPIIPILNVGLLPILQMVILPLFTFKIASKIIK